jgi:hypothetical protein
MDIELIMWIIGLPKAGEDLTTLFNKVGEKAQSESMRDKFHNFRGKRGLDVVNIDDDGVRFAMQVLAWKLLRKCCKDEVFAAVISVVKNVRRGSKLIAPHS